jgi:signal transduction histidine kinase
MRERAEALGGTLTAGPRPGGGWRVRAVLPLTSAPPPVPGRRRLPGAEHVIDVVLFLLALFPPVGALLVTDGDPDLVGAPVPLLILVAAVHAVPVIWRRTHPWAVLAAVAATAWLLPVLIAAGPVAPALGWVMPAGLGAEVLAVYAVARYARRNNLTALAIPAALISAALASGVTLALDAPPEEGIPFVGWAILMSAGAGCGLMLPMVGAWLTGFLVRRRRTNLEAREHDAVATSTAQAIWEAGFERARVAAGLQAAVLRDTTRVATAADAGDLDQVVTSARTALDAMRGLLNGLRAETDPGRDAGDRDPQPTTAALPGLADRWRANGRQVGLEIHGAGRTLPADADLSAFRVVELLLAGDTGPVTVRVDLTGDPLRISMRPMPADEGGEIAAGLRARLAAVGGTMGTANDGLPEILLPAPMAGYPGVSRPVSSVVPLPEPAVAGRPASDSPASVRPGRAPTTAMSAAVADGSTSDTPAPARPGPRATTASPGGADGSTSDSPAPVRSGQGPMKAVSAEGRAAPPGASDPAGAVDGPAGSISAGTGPGTPAGDDKEVASSPSG